MATRRKDIATELEEQHREAVTPKVSERIRDQILNPQPYVSRMTFRLGATIPTGDYANLSPSIEITYDLPEGATPPQSTAVLDELRGSLVDSVYPMIIEQTNKIHLTVKMMQSSDNEQETIRKALSASPLFSWLSTIDPVSASMIVGHRLEAYEAALERAQAELAARQAAAIPKNPAR